jgi:predicted CxxxxCH...CXXCH cytochrome family protein
MTRALACDACHQVPEHVKSEGHLDRGTVSPADIHFGTLASARGCEPSYSQGRCSDVACHGARLPERIELAWTWNTGPRTEACSGCHGLPPSVQHTKDSHCASLLCHGAEVSAASDPPAITDGGRSLHIDGRYDTTQR